jgi:hypothetical protein
LGGFDPSLRGKGKVVAACLISKPLEFGRFKIQIAQLLAQPQEFDGAAAAHPVIDDGKRLLASRPSSALRVSAFQLLPRIN